MYVVLTLGPVRHLSTLVINAIVPIVRIIPEEWNSPCHSRDLRWVGVLPGQETVTGHNFEYFNGWVSSSLIKHHSYSGYQAYCKTVHPK